MFIQSEKKKRLTLDVIGLLEDDLEADELNYDKWSKLIKLALVKDKEEQVRNIFTKYLTIFKFDGQQWCNYINYELNRGEFKKVESLFQKCFLITQSVELYRLYVSYVRRVNDVITGGEMARGIVIQAFEFAVSKVGIDITSSPLWKDYLDFLKSWTPAATWEQQQKIDLIRKVYKRYLVIPTENIESLWSQYTKWENEVNSSTASKFISEKSAEFMLARSWNTEWHNVTKSQLIRTIVPHGIENTLTQNQLTLWHQWLDLERRNSLQIKDESLLKQRLEYVYRQSTMSLVFVPEVWFKFSNFWLLDNEDANLNKCTSLLTDSLTINPKSLLLTFQLAELYEKDNDFEKSKEAYETLARVLVKDYDLCNEQIKELEGKTKKVISNGTGDDQDADDDDDDEDQDAEIESNEPVFQFSEDDAKTLISLYEEEKVTIRSITLVYSKLMMASKRSQGMKEARGIFKQAREHFKPIGHEIYVQSALREHYSDNKKSALKIFELALKYFGTNGEFLMSYLTYLINANDVDNARKLIQTADANISKDVTQLKEQIASPDLNSFYKQLKQHEINSKKVYLRKLYKAYISYAFCYLSLDVANSFANRYQQLFPEDDPIDLFSDRYRIDNMNLIKRLELASTESEISDDEPVPKRRKVQNSENVAFESSGSTQTNNNNFSLPPIPGTQTTQHGFVGSNIYNLLRVLPNASYFGTSSDHVFDAGKLIELFTNLPNTTVD
ncbi:uncharacterized protein PRCAT00001203001 [Priceomyces carsonii]|uniref:uncharacterized protein n=1 Tax=Priceomyces carsonii TaxID=28549 RepID=UPI002EDB7813|nr:unnamed protein product [Priceomyces carsonii]